MRLQQFTYLERIVWRESANRSPGPTESHFYPNSPHYHLLVGPWCICPWARFETRTHNITHHTYIHTYTHRPIQLSIHLPLLLLWLSKKGTMWYRRVQNSTVTAKVNSNTTFTPLHVITSYHPSHCILHLKHRVSISSLLILYSLFLFHFITPPSNSIDFILDFFHNDPWRYKPNTLARTFHLISSQDHKYNHITMLPAARTFNRSPGLVGGVAVTASTVPILFFLPGFEERLASQAAKWGPRWTRGFAQVTPRIERGAARVDPRIQKSVKTVEPPFKRAAM